MAGVAMLHELGPARRTLTKLVVHAAHLLSAILGDDVAGKAVRHAVYRALGARIGRRDTHLHGGSHLSRPANLTVGDHCFVNRGCYFDLGGTVVLGDHVTVGHGVTMISTTHDLGPSGHRAGAVTGRPIVVEDGCWIGANATILPGVTVHQGAVVAAGAVVTVDVPPDTMVAGVPARVIRLLDEDDLGRPRDVVDLRTAAGDDHARPERAGRGDASGDGLAGAPPADHPAGRGRV